MIEKINKFLERIIFYDGLIFYINLLFDRILYLSFYKYYYPRKFLYYGKNVRWGKHAKRLTIPRSVRIANAHLISIGDNCQFDEFVYIQCHHEGKGLYFGKGVRVNAFVHIQAYSKIKIANDVLIAPFSHINSGNHGFADTEQPVMFQEYNEGGPIQIDQGVWIGRNAHVFGGAALGKNCVVGANSVVTKSFGGNSVVAGVPAKLLKVVQ